MWAFHVGARLFRTNSLEIACAVSSQSSPKRNLEGRACNKVPASEKEAALRISVAERMQL